MRGLLITSLLLASGCGGPRPAPASRPPPQPPSSPCEREVVASAERVHARLGQLARTLEASARRLKATPGQGLPRETRQRLARAISELILDLPPMIVAEYADRFEQVVANEDRLLASPPAAATGSGQQLAALGALGRQLRWIDSHYTPLLMARPLYWINLCDGARPPTSQPAPPLAELERRRQVVSRASAALAAAGRCRRLGVGIRAVPAARRQASMRELQVCTGEARRAYRRCARELLPLLPTAQAAGARRAARLVARVGGLRRDRALSHAEVQALRARISPLLASFPVPLDALSLRADAAQTLQAFRPRQPHRELIQLIRALERLASPCMPLLLPDPRCLTSPEVCRLRPNAARSPAPR